MSAPLVLSSVNAIPYEIPSVTYGSQFIYYQYQYNFPTNVDFIGKEVSPNTLIVPYSNPNFLDLYNNNTFSYVWLGTVYTVYIGNQNLTASGLNLFLQYTMIQNLTYLIDSNGNFVYYLQISENPSQYAIELDSIPIPTAAQAATLKYTQPVGATWVYPVNPINPQFIIPVTASNRFGTSIGVSLGFTSGSYPPGNPGVGYSIISQVVPEINPVSSVIVQCSLVQNNFSSNNKTFYTFSFGNTTYGSYLQILVPTEFYYNVVTGNFANFTVSFFDQTGINPVPLLDPTACILINVRTSPLADRALISKTSQGMARP